MMSSPALCDERYCWAEAVERRSFATKTSRSRADFLLCAAHDEALEGGASFEIVSELGPEGWVQYIIISPH